MTASPEGVCTLIIDQRPPTANQQRGKNSRWQTINQTAGWRALGKHKMQEQIRGNAIPPQVDSIRAEIRQLAVDGRWHQDIGACMPAWKAVEDGIVDAGLIPDDTARYVTSVAFFPCRIAGLNGMQIDIHWTPLKGTTS